MIALDDRRSVAPRVARAGSARPRTLGARPRVVARRRPAGRFVEYGAVGARVGAPHPVRAPSGTGPRVRTVVAGALLLAVLTAGVLGLTSLGGSAPAGMPTETGVVAVHGGENLSILAARVAPGAPTSAVVQRIVQLNGLRGASVRAGQVLVVPLGR